MQEDIFRTKSDGLMQIICLEEEDPQINLMWHLRTLCYHQTLGCSDNGTSFSLRQDCLVNQLPLQMGG